MKPLPLTPELLAVAPRIIWFEPPEQALADPYRFMAYLMTYGTIAELAVVEKYVGAEGFREAIRHAPPGIMDPRSWAYWNLMADIDPVPPMPVRDLGE